MHGSDSLTFAVADTDGWWQDQVMGENSASFFDCLSKNVRRIPRIAWAVAAFASVASAGIDISLWASHRKLDLSAYSWLAYAVTTTGVVVYFAALYTGAINAAGMKPTMRGYLRFSAASLSLWIPLAATFGLLFIFKEQVPQNARIWIFLAVMLSTMSLLILLAAWPLLQASSTTLVSPIRVIRATRGHRWSLLSAYFVVIGTNGNRILPDVASAKSLGQAVFFGLGQASLALFGFAVVASTMITAWKFATNNDPGLKDPSILPEALSA